MSQFVRLQNYDSSMASKGMLIDTGMIKAPTPFLRWAGGKRKLAELIIDMVPLEFFNGNSKFYEPFLGGGAVTFALGDKSKEKYIKGSRLVINDMNPDLIQTYRIVKKDPVALMKSLDRLAKDLSREAFERIRSQKPKDDLNAAARFIYLNKTCFNGLWRVNGNGEFNVPWGKLKKPLIYSKENLLACSERLLGSRILHMEFDLAVNSTSKGDLVYFDPPYIPLSSSASFSKYSKNDFTLDDQEKLADVIDVLTKKGVRVILSNSDTTYTRKIFRNSLELRQISVGRSISAASTSRKRVNEVIGTNFKLSANSAATTLKIINKSR
jgi:DNA adenine methylase